MTSPGRVLDARTGVPPAAIFRLRIHDVPCLATPKGRVKGHETRQWALLAYHNAGLRVYQLDCSESVKDTYDGCQRCHIFAAVSVRGPDTASGQPTWGGLADVLTAADSAR